MQIKPGDYVAVSDITCEAIHAAVVKCFEAAGYKLYEGHKIGTLRGIGLGISEYLNTIESLGASVVKRQLTLQQLFTATNSIRWPDFATEVRHTTGHVYFYGGGAPVLTISNDSNPHAPEVPLILATRPSSTVSDAGIRPAPELHWYDWSADRARELPPVGERVTVGRDKRPADVKCYLKTGSVLVEYDNSEVGFYDKSALRPANYSKRKAELNRDKNIAAAVEALKDSGKWPELNDECYDLLTVLHNAGLLRERAV